MTSAKHHSIEKKEDGIAEPEPGGVRKRYIYVEKDYGEQHSKGDRPGQLRFFKKIFRQSVVHLLDFLLQI